MATQPSRLAGNPNGRRAGGPCCRMSAWIGPTRLLSQPAFQSRRSVEPACRKNTPASAGQRQPQPRRQQAAAALEG